VTSVTDSRGNSYTLVPASLVSAGPTPHYANINTQIAYASDIADGSNTVTVTWSSGVNGGFVSLLEISPGKFSQASTGTGASNAPSAGTVTTTVNGAFGAATSFIDNGLGSGNAFTAGPGWTMFQNCGGGAASQGSEYQAQAASGALTGNFTASSGTWVASMAVFVPNGGTTPVRQAPSVLHTKLTNAIAGFSPNPMTRDELARLVKQNGWKIYSLTGTPIENQRIKQNGIYFLGTRGQALKKIMVIE
jgi:hypothetical protein